ncbi:MAG: ATP-binding protein [Pseudomonadota bacterium]
MQLEQNKDAVVLWGWPLIGLVVLVTMLILGIAWLADDVRLKLNRLATAQSDNVAWSLAQLEVEFQAFETASLAALHDLRPNLETVTTRFDIFYSRVSGLNTAGRLSRMRDDADFAAHLSQVTRYRDWAAAQIDSGQVLIAASPEFSDQTEAAHDAIRQLSLRGANLTGTAAEVGRQRLASVLSRLALAALFLVAGLIAALIVVARLLARAGARSREIMHAAARLDAVSSTALDAILVSDRDGRVLNFNAAAEQLFGYEADMAIGKNFAELIVPDHHRKRHEAGMARYRETGEMRVVGTGRLQLDARRASGEVFPAELAIAKTEGPDGELFVAFIRDVSARVAAEAELRQARDDALAGEKAKTNLLAVMSHEMRTPLNGILGSLELLAATDMTAQQRDHLRVMSRSGDVLLHHVNDVLELSRLDAGQTKFARETFGLAAMLQEVSDTVRPMADANGNTVTLNLPAEVASPVVGDPRRLRQVILNLAGNAVKFTENGRVTVSAMRIAGSDAVDISVTDTGIGISEADQSRIFDEFVTIDPSYDRKAEGTGLGLAITRKLVLAMGGTIDVESRPGHGSAFRIRVPLPVCHKVPRHAPAKPKMRFDGVEVLLVEDNPINRRIAMGMLKPMGVTVTEAVNGSEGVAAAASRSFDIIFMDISMPELDGTEATRRIRAGPSASRNVPIVALTAHSMDEDIERFEAAGMNGVLLKPISSDRLAEVLAQHCGAAAMAQPGPPILDPQVHGEFAEVLGPEETAAMVAKFLDDASHVIPWLLRHNDDDHAAEDVAKRAHALAGSAAVLGAKALHAALFALETSARKGRSLAADCRHLAEIWPTTKDALAMSAGDTGPASAA